MSLKYPEVCEEHKENHPKIIQKHYVCSPVEHFR